MALTNPYIPVPVDNIEPTSVVDHLVPFESDIPTEFWTGSTHWNDIAHQWFYYQLSADTKFYVVEGIDGNAACRHLFCILTSYQLSHQYKIASVAFLLSRWCQRVENWRKSDVGHSSLGVYDCENSHD